MGHSHSCQILLQIVPVPITVLATMSLPHGNKTSILKCLQASAAALQAIVNQFIWMQQHEWKIEQKEYSLKILRLNHRKGTLQLSNAASWPRKFTKVNLLCIRKLSLFKLDLFPVSRVSMILWSPNSLMAAWMLLLGCSFSRKLYNSIYLSWNHCNIIITDIFNICMCIYAPLIYIRVTHHS